MVARTGEGLGLVRQRVPEPAGWQPAAAEGPYISRARHVAALRQVGIHLGSAAPPLAAQAQALALMAGGLPLAQQALDGIPREVTPDDLLGVVFSRCCIGK